jgi:hypothetical protein
MVSLLLAVWLRLLRLAFPCAPLLSPRSSLHCALTRVPACRSFFMKEKKTDDAVKMASMEKAMADYEIVEEDKDGNVIAEDKPPTV